MGSLLHPVGLPHQTTLWSPPLLKALSLPGATSSLISTTRGLLFSRRLTSHAAPRRRWIRRLSNPNRGISGGEVPEAPVEELRVPDAWLLPSNALEESEWLRVTLHKWLDDEYCPEPSNVEISRLAAWSYYQSLMSKQTELGEILLKMARDLENLSYQQSFHGAFSSANAAVQLITQRIMDSCGTEA